MNGLFCATVPCDRRQPVRGNINWNERILFEPASNKWYEPQRTDMRGEIMIGKEDFAARIEQKSGMLYRVASTILRSDEDCRDALQAGQR